MKHPQQCSLRLANVPGTSFQDPPLVRWPCPHAMAQTRGPRRFFSLHSDGSRIGTRFASSGMPTTKEPMMNLADERQGPKTSSTAVLDEPRRPATRRVTCPTCGQGYRVPAAGQSSGKGVRCKRCDQVFSLTRSASSVPSSPSGVKPVSSRTPRRTTARTKRAVYSDPITFWHWLSATVLLAGAIAGLAFLVS